MRRREKSIRDAYGCPPEGEAALSAAKPPASGERDFKDAVEAANQAAPPPPELPAPVDPGTLMPLAEAIAQTAFDSQKGMALTTIQTAVDTALLGDPGQLLSKIADPRGLSGVGNAGSSNFANEPVVVSPPKTPNEPPVSR